MSLKCPPHDWGSMFKPSPPIIIRRQNGPKPVKFHKISYKFVITKNPFQKNYKSSILNNVEVSRSVSYVQVVVCMRNPVIHDSKVE